MDESDVRLFAIEKYLDFIASIDLQWNDWLSAVHMLTEEQILSSGTCGEWSVKDLIAHVAAWDAIAAEKVRDISAGIISDSRETTDEFNRRIAAQFQHTPTEELTTMMLTGHQNLADSLERALTESDEILERIEWAVVEDTSRHYAVHEAHIRRRLHHVR